MPKQTKEHWNITNYVLGLLVPVQKIKEEALETAISCNEANICFALSNYSFHINQQNTTHLATALENILHIHPHLCDDRKCSAFFRQFKEKLKWENYSVHRNTTFWMEMEINLDITISRPKVWVYLSSQII